MLAAGTGYLPVFFAEFVISPSNAHTHVYLRPSVPHMCKFIKSTRPRAGLVFTVIDNQIHTAVGCPPIRPAVAGTHHTTRVLQLYQY